MKRDKDMIEYDPNMWHLLFKQVPVIFKWIGGALVAAIGVLGAGILRYHNKRVDRLEQQMNDRMDREMALLHGRLDETNRLLMQIAQNTNHD